MTIRAHSEIHICDLPRILAVVYSFPTIRRNITIRVQNLETGDSDDFHAESAMRIINSRGLNGRKLLHPHVFATKRRRVNFCLISKELTVTTIIVILQIEKFLYHTPSFLADSVIRCANPIGSRVFMYS